MASSIDHMIQSQQSTEVPDKPFSSRIRNCSGESPLMHSSKRGFFPERGLPALLLGFKTPVSFGTLRARKDRDGLKVVTPADLARPTHGISIRNSSSAAAVMLHLTHEAQLYACATIFNLGVSPSQSNTRLAVDRSKRARGSQSRRCPGPALSAKLALSLHPATLVALRSTGRWR
ncbi:hypothetical protein Emed_007170 [Eimeria media]